MQKKICHLTSVHQRYDIRVFHKECISLARNSFDTTLIVADGQGDENKSNVNIIDVGKPKGRINRILFSTKKIYFAALKTNSHIYHFHDPELFLVGFFLRMKNKTVIFDAHEDFPKQILQKEYMPLQIRKVISKLLTIIDKNFSTKFDQIITATPHIEEKYYSFGCQSLAIMNYPILKREKKLSWENRAYDLCYAGLLSENRGLINLLDAIVHTDYKVIIAGKFSDDNFERKVKMHNGWKQVDFLGFISQKKLKEIYNNSKIGVGLFHEAPNHNYGITTKLYEYMTHGMPVIISNSVISNTETVAKHECGIIVNHSNTQEIIDAINFLLLNSETAIKMGTNGLDAVEKYFNWSNEEKKLIQVYNNLLTK